jgi:uncharacterized protein (TIGR02147 family)
MILDSQQLIKDFLLQYYQNAKAKNSKFSKRSFAKKLEISSSSLSEIITGKRKVSYKKALALASKINLHHQDLVRLRFSYEQNKKFENLNKLNLKLKEVVIEKEDFEIIFEWEYFAIIALIRTSDFKNDLKWISKRLIFQNQNCKHV